MRMNASINMEWIKELVFRTADEAGEQFVIDSWNTDNEIFLGQDCVKIIRLHHIGSHWKPEKY